MIVDLSHQSSFACDCWSISSEQLCLWLLIYLIRAALLIAQTPPAVDTWRHCSLNQDWSAVETGTVSVWRLQSDHLTDSQCSVCDQCWMFFLFLVSKRDWREWIHCGTVCVTNAGYWHCGTVCVTIAGYCQYWLCQYVVEVTVHTIEQCVWPQLDIDCAVSVCRWGDRTHYRTVCVASAVSLCRWGDRTPYRTVCVASAVSLCRWGDRTHYRTVCVASAVSLCRWGDRTPYRTVCGQCWI